MSDYDWFTINSDASQAITKMLKQNGDYKHTLNYSFLKNLLPCTENNFKLDWNDIEKIFPDLVVAMKNTPQEKDYHAEGDVWTHTKMVVEALLDNSEYRNLPYKEQEIMFWTVLFHDIGKPGVTRRNEENNRITSRGHSKRGAQDSRLLMWYAGFPPEIRESVARIIMVHQYPFTWINEANTFQLRELSQSMKMNHLKLMAQADALGRETEPYSEKRAILDRVELFAFACEEEKCLIQPWKHNFSSLYAERLYWEGRGESHEERPVYWNKKSDVIMLSGLPASGKDTWVSKFGEGKPVLSFDNARALFGFKQSDNHGEAVQYVMKEARRMLANEESFIWNATHLSPLTRDKNINLLRSYGATVRIIHLESDPKTLLERNEKRGSTLQGGKILSMAYKWEPPLPTDCHEMLWWDKDGPVYLDFLTSKKDKESPWKFSKENISKKFKP